MDIKFFTNNLTRYAASYNPAALFDKIRKVAKKAGVKLVYIVLVLYYATLDKELPIKDRLMVLAALGYFIFPLDFIPDALPGGFADDTAAIFYVVKKIWKNLTPQTKQKARDRLKDWFGDTADPHLNVSDI